MTHLVSVISTRSISSFTLTTSCIIDRFAPDAIKASPSVTQALFYSTVFFVGLGLIQLPLFVAPGWVHLLLSVPYSLLKLILGTSASIILLPYGCILVPPLFSLSCSYFFRYMTWYPLLIDAKTLLNDLSCSQHPNRFNISELSSTLTS